MFPRPPRPTLFPYNDALPIYLDIHLRQPENKIARFAQAHDVAYHVVDGNDVVAVARAAEDLIARSRAGDGPGFLEAVTRSEEHTSELQSHVNLVCRLLLEKKK